MTYSPYGHLDTTEDIVLIAFNGQWRDPRTTCYLLGSYRLFSPQLQRFCSPDSFSPFASGGLNAYNYCADDPINYTDTSGHTASSIFRRLLYSKKTPRSKYEYYQSKTAALRKKVSDKRKDVKDLNSKLFTSKSRTMKDTVMRREEPDKYEQSVLKRLTKMVAAKEDLKKAQGHLKRNITKLVAAANEIHAADPTPTQPSENEITDLSERVSRVRFNTDHSDDV
ncbi:MULTISPECIES: RHS repeat-associated core domain-containing protein [Pseudomonas]|uniref:RHS repeat-associated core domain-containing protein n=1 Tax=Pseudomonas TaxID=286 RepID=UPI002DBD7496|nr:RHS repeat-associated core domain-containing protein [Pseudomonas asiatica]MEB6588612.1 RHS repeat-associated core domain-containing protein [Pseudomonas asiatica]